MIAQTGEHPECELKSEWRRDTPYLKAEFVKDIQSIANSSIPENSDNYIVVGADDVKREIVGCNHADFDEAPIRQLLESHLDPTPEFEVLRPKTTEGVAYVILRVPHQPNRPFVAKRSIREKPYVHLAEGQIWIKPGGANTGSTQKRLVTTRAEILSLFDNTEALVESRVTDRLNQLIPDIRLEERTRVQGRTLNSVSALTSTDMEFEYYLEQVLGVGNETQFSLIVERLRDQTLGVWDCDKRSEGSFTPEEIAAVKEATFLPAMNRIVLLGLLLIKFSAPIEWFNRLAELLVEIFLESNSLGRCVAGINKESDVSSLEEHRSHTVPAVESLLAAYLLGGYEVSKRNDTVYTKTLFPRIVTPVTPPYEEWVKNGLYLWWPLTRFCGTPNRQRDLMVLDRYGKGDRIEELVGGKKAIRKAALQLDFLVDWHSFMSLKGMGEPATIRYFEVELSSVITQFRPHYPYEQVDQVMPLIEKIWASLSTGDHEFWLLSDRLAELFGSIELDQRKAMLGRFLLYAKRQQDEWMWQARRLPYHEHWPPGIAEIVDAARLAQSQKPA